MTKKLVELFNLADQDLEENPVEHDLPTPATLEEIDDIIERVDLALPTVRDLDTADQELDSLAQTARDGYDQMMDLAMNVEPRFSGPIFQTAATMIGHAITAKTAKLDKKLRMIDLQLKKARLDQVERKEQQKAQSSDVISGVGTVLDRNEILKLLAQENKNAKTDK
jgi:phytoene dehydrogenase-like protein